MKPKQSQSERIIKWLKIRRGKHGRTLTAIEALVKFECWNLKARVFDLRKKYNIITEMVWTKSRKRIAKYHLA